MPLLKYTTSIEASKTVMEIQNLLSKHGARQILMEYGDGGIVEALSFIITVEENPIPFRLPINIDAVLRILNRQGVAPAFKNRPQAVRVAWRIVKHWIEAQMAILETEMVKMEQIFLPYMVVKDNKTLYESIRESKFLLTSGR